MLGDNAALMAHHRDQTSDLISHPDNLRVLNVLIKNRHGIITVNETDLQANSKCYS